MELVSYGEVERMWKEAVISYLKVLFRIFLEELRKTTETRTNICIWYLSDIKK
jgi:hypothetical protein